MALKNKNLYSVQLERLTSISVKFKSLQFAHSYSLLTEKNIRPAANKTYLAPPPGQFFMGTKLFIETN